MFPIYHRHLSHKPNMIQDAWCGDLNKNGLHTFHSLLKKDWVMLVTLASQMCCIWRIQRRLRLRVLAALQGHLSSVPSNPHQAICQCL